MPLFLLTAYEDPTEDDTWVYEATSAPRALEAFEKDGWHYDEVFVFEVSKASKQAYVPKKSWVKADKNKKNEEE